MSTDRGCCIFSVFNWKECIFQLLKITEKETINATGEKKETCKECVQTIHDKHLRNG